MISEVTYANVDAILTFLYNRFVKSSLSHIFGPFYQPFNLHDLFPHFLQRSSGEVTHSEMPLTKSSISAKSVAPNSEKPKLSTSIAPKTTSSDKTKVLSSEMVKSDAVKTSSKSTSLASSDLKLVPSSQDSKFALDSSRIMAEMTKIGAELSSGVESKSSAKNLAEPSQSSESSIYAILWHKYRTYALCNET